MIVVDSSAVVAIIKQEDTAERCIRVLRDADMVLMSAGTLSELFIVGTRYASLAEIERLIRLYDLTILDVTAAVARQVGEAYARWGKGVHPAKLNFGDCFAYVAARAHRCPLLYVGEDFARTDVVSALAAEGE